jgi:hypothetical protein
VDGFDCYLRRLALFAIVLVLALAGFNALVDPYGNFDVPRISGVNRLPLGFNHRPLLAKALAVTRVRPASIILGNSRAESGYDAEHPGFAARPAYNLGMGGAGLGELRRFFLEALAAGPVEQVLLAIDVTLFDPSLDAVQRIPGPVMLTEPDGTPAGPVRKWLRLAFVLLSGTASSDSWWSLRHQRDPVAVYLPSGRRDESYDERQVEREGGHRSASLHTEAAFLATTLRDVGSDGFRAGYGTVMAELAEMVAQSAQRGIRLDVVINPIHARQSYMYAAAGLWPAYERWKRDVAALASRSPGRIALWDFSGVSECTAEPMPREGDAATKMRWYRESGHFRPALGDVVLDRVYGRPQGACPGLGRRLDAAGIDATLAAQRAALERWIDQHPADAAEIDALARRYGRRAALRPSTMMQSPNRTASEVMPGSGNPRRRRLARMMRATSRSTRRVAQRLLRTSALVDRRSIFTPPRSRK